MVEGPENHEKSGNRPFSNRETHFRNFSADQAILKFSDFLGNVDLMAIADPLVLPSVLPLVLPLVEPSGGGPAKMAKILIFHDFS